MQIYKKKYKCTKINMITICTKIDAMAIWSITKEELQYKRV